MRANASQWTSPTVVRVLQLGKARPGEGISQLIVGNTGPAMGLGYPSVFFEGGRFAHNQPEMLERLRERRRVERFDEVDIEPCGLRFASEAVEPGQCDRRDRADRRRQPA